MVQSYKIKEVKIELSSGVTLTVEVESVAQLKELIAELQHEEMLNYQPPSREKSRNAGLDENNIEDQTNSKDNPLSLIEEKAELQSNSLTTKRILGFKNGHPQILRPTSFTSQEGVFALLYALEYGMGKSKVSFEEFKTLYEQQGIKSGSPLVMTVNNLKNNNYLDKKIYESGRHLTLNARGATKAIEVLKSK